MKELSRFFIPTFILLSLTSFIQSNQMHKGTERGEQKPDVSIVTDPDFSAPVSHGLQKITGVLQEKNLSYEFVHSIEAVRGKTILVAGLVYGKGVARQIMNEHGILAPQSPEGLTIRHTTWRDKPLWIIAGTDGRGLMYGLLDISMRMGWSNNPAALMEHVKEITESPYVSERAISLFTMNRTYWESRFYDEAYWKRYLDCLAQNRFNTLVVIFGYENGGFLAPPYPYFFNVEGFDEVRMVGMTAKQQQRNINALNRLKNMAHDRGIKFSVGIWDHIYRGGVQRGGISESAVNAEQRVEGLVYGVDENNLISYTKAALSEFIEQVPGIDIIQFRMHGESGLKEEEQEDFWADIFGSIKQQAPELSLILRAKDMPEAVIHSALNSGVNFSIGTKYWMEQLGLPYHPTQVNLENRFDRRHGYADMLHYPKQYSMYWRVWNGGTTRVLLWGSPEYTRRFVESTKLYDGIGFEVNEPLATKMLAQPHKGVEPFELLNSQNRYYDFEFERYWHFFQVFGRIGYNPQADSEIWHNEFKQRFGEKAGPLVEEALHLSSWILPRIVASVYNYYTSFPLTRGWPEKQRLGDLPMYAEGEGSDIQQFASFDEAARLLIERGQTTKILPSVNSYWFEQISREINSLISQAENEIGNEQNKEFKSTMVDMKILSNLALYHSRRIPAAVSYRLFEHTKDIAALDNAISYERDAIAAWEQIAEAAGDVYADTLKMGVNPRGGRHRGDQTGHWRNELEALYKGMAELEMKKQNLDPATAFIKSPSYKPALSDPGNQFIFIHKPIKSHKVGEDLSVTAKVSSELGIKWVSLRYRGINQQLDYKTIKMKPTGQKNEYRAVIPSEDINPQWDLMYFFEIMDNEGNGKIFPDLKLQTPYIIVELVR